MITAFLLGLTGSFGHCVGMCSGVSLLLSRRGSVRGWRMLMLHAGRIFTYSLFGGVAGLASIAFITFISYCTASLNLGSGNTGNNGVPGIAQIQGFVALLTAGLALYMALALIGRLPSPELVFVRITRRWGKVMRQMTTRKEKQLKLPDFVTAFGMGMMWGMLPCGLVLTGLVAAAATGSPARGMLTMLAFGVGTWPVPIAISLVAQLKKTDARQYLKPQFRYVAAIVVCVFALQMTLRGFAAWGWVNHYHLGEIVLW